MQPLTYGQLIRGNRDFRNLLAGQFVSELGSWFNFIAVLGLVRVMSDASPIAAGIIFVCRLAPLALLAPIAGGLADRFSRRQIMLWTDIARAAVALLPLLVVDRDDLWIAYIATVLLSAFSSFFDGAKNAATPNLTGKDGLLAGTALMFSTRFLLMAVGSALGGWAAAVFGYEISFIINAISFLVSAYTVWLIPEDAVREAATAERKPETTFIAEIREGLVYTVKNHFALTILLLNVIWATGGGAINIVFERMGGGYFAAKDAWNPDMAVGLLWTAAGLGLFLGMMLAHRASIYFDRKGTNRQFIGWALIVHGVLFAVGGLMPAFWMLLFFTFISRAIIGVEYAVQETMFQRSLPDYIRGRISTLDRGAELTMYGLTTYLASLAVYAISPQTLTVISGLLAGSAGVVWFLRTRPSSGGPEVEMLTASPPPVRP